MPGLGVPSRMAACVYKVGLRKLALNPLRKSRSLTDPTLPWSERETHGADRKE